MKSNRMRAEAAAWMLRRLLIPRHRRNVELASLRVGQQAGLPMEAWARLTGDESLLVCTLADSPHVELLEEARRRQAPPSNDWLVGSRYLALARRCLQEIGHFHGAVDEAGLLQVARDFGLGFLEKRAWNPRLPRVARLADSPVFEIVDGHHRLAMALAAGASQLDVEVQGRVPSWWQRKLQQVNMTRRDELYQPVDLPEVAHWALVRRCTDRLALIERFLDERALPTGTLLDLGSSYGWFTARLKPRFPGGVLAVDRDPAALDVPRLLFGLRSQELLVRRAEDYLADGTRPPADAVLFLSLLHHYAIGKEPGEVDQIVAGLGRVTGRVLFLDTGEGHEDWFRRKLPGWTPDFVAELVLRKGGFREAVALGVDSDKVPPNAGNYGRTLFAFLK